MKNKRILPLKTILLLFCATLFLVNCEKEEVLPDPSLLTTKEQAIIDEIRETDEFALLSQALLRIKYYTYKTGLSYQELREFALDKNKSAVYENTIDQAGVKKGSIVYDVRLFLQLSLSIEETYFMDDAINCGSRKAMQYVLSTLITERSLEVMNYELESYKNRSGKYARGAIQSLCVHDGQCPVQQMCCFDMNTYK
ncbi:hypothetical protein ACQY1Q_07680 [Tenacibaculum sp. TC6]|uniref:hypothetical protein n=1 Tax=Tenacibaculum sp. TC6 TaxID=3423223 RepID=UPI003D36BA42